MFLNAPQCLLPGASVKLFINTSAGMSAQDNSGTAMTGIVGSVDKMGQHPFVAETLQFAQPLTCPSGHHEQTACSDPQSVAALHSVHPNCPGTWADSVINTTGSALYCFQSSREI